MQEVHMSTNWKQSSPDSRCTSNQKEKSAKTLRTNSANLSSTQSAQDVPTLGRVLGVDELAAFFGCSTEKIKRRARAGELPAFKFGKSWFVRERDLEVYIQRAVQSGHRPPP